MGMFRVMCTVGSCNQRACVASGEDQVCGDHWKATLEHRAVESQKDELLRLTEGGDADDIREVLRRLIERSFN
jgi:hypothetical protein